MNCRSILFVVGFLISFQANANSSAQEIFENRASVYAGAVGVISITERILSEINNKCDADLGVPYPTLIEIDYLLRKNTGYKYSEFVDLMEKQTENAELEIQKNIRPVMSQVTSCSQTDLENWAYFLPVSYTHLTLPTRSEV